MNLNCFIISVALLAVGLTAGCATEHDIESDHKKDFTGHLVLETRTGQYKEKPGDTEWTETTSRIVSGSCRPEVPALTAWGGRKDLTATDIEGTDGYFRLGRVGRRWVFVDPEGGVNIIRGTQNVAYPESSRFAIGGRLGRRNGGTVARLRIQPCRFHGRTAAVSAERPKRADTESCRGPKEFAFRSPEHAAVLYVGRRPEPAVDL